MAGIEHNIALTNLLMAFLPVLIVIFFYYRWSLNLRNVSYALVRMLAQLLLVGYVLAYIFNTDWSLLVLSILFLMAVISSWIALNTIEEYRNRLFLYAVIAISVGGGLTLVAVSQLVLNVMPWYSPQFMIPLGGMVFANAMTSVSLCAERYFAERERVETFEQARSVAFNAGMIPVVNSLFAVGLVSLPGMMTGQILSGVSPLIAARYQIVVMCMIFSSAGIASALFLILIRNKFFTKTQRDA